MQAESYSLSNGQSLRVFSGKLWLTRNAGFSDAFKTLATLPFAVLSFVLTAASLRSFVEEASFSAFIGFLFGVAGLLTTWFFFKHTMGAIAGMPNLIMERTDDGAIRFLGASANGAEFVARFGSLGVRLDNEIETLVSGLFPDEASALADRLNDVFFAPERTAAHAAGRLERDAHSFGA
jgi:hypothetical protein